MNPLADILLIALGGIGAASFYVPFKKVRDGESLAFSSEALKCGGAKRYLGFTDKMRPNFEYFLSCGIENEMEGERYIRTPEMVKELMKNQKKPDIHGKYIVFKRWDKLDQYDNPDVVIFFATPDILEKDSQRPRAVIGMFDVKARPCVPAGVLTFSVPMIKFTKMISYMDERFLITDSWKEVQKCIK